MLLEAYLLQKRNRRHNTIAASQLINIHVILLVVSYRECTQQDECNQSFGVFDVCFGEPHRDLKGFIHMY